MYRTLAQAYPDVLHVSQLFEHILAILNNVFLVLCPPSKFASSVQRAVVFSRYIQFVDLVQKTEKTSFGEVCSRKHWCKVGCQARKRRVVSICDVSL